MKKLLAPFCLTLIIFIGSVGMSKGAEPINGWCSGEKHAHFPIAGKCSASYEKGDYATALREWKTPAEQGLANAQFNLGQMYLFGRGVPKNHKTAVKWFRLAAEQGNGNAQYNLGVMYTEGLGVSLNYKTAVKWYRLAAKQGNAHGQYNLGVMYAFGRGVLKDYIYAHMWGNIAGTNGNKRSVRLQNLAARRMTSAQIVEAKKLARECVRKKYKGC